VPRTGASSNFWVKVLNGIVEYQYLNCKPDELLTGLSE
jgi:hypothetical protein